jgi:hypothetical protein
VTRLRTIPQLDDVILAAQRTAPVAAAGAEAAVAPSLAWVRALSWSAWIAALAHALQSGAPLTAETSAAIARFHADTRTLRDAQRRAFAVIAREATTYDRVGRVNHVVLPLLREYATGPHELDFVPLDVSGAPPQRGLVYTIPDLVLGEVDRFMGVVQPAEDQSAQVVAMVLEIAPELSRLLGVDRDASLAHPSNVRFAIVMALRPLLSAVTRFVDGRDATPDGVARRTTLDAVLLASERGDAWISPRLERLRAINAALETMLVTGQKMFGFLALKVSSVAASTANFFESVGPGARIPLGARFTIDGIRYRIMRLDHQLEYHEPSGSGDARLDSTLVIDGVPKKWAERASLSTVLFELEIGTPASRREVTANQRDDALLDQISRAVQMNAIVESMRELGEALETFSMLMLDAVEFIPGAGQAVMVARLSMVILQFIASGEMDQLIALVRNDPMEVLRRAAGVFASVIHPEQLLEFFLFGVNRLEELGSATRAAGSRPIVQRSGGSGRLARIVQRLWQFGRNMLAAFGRVQGRVRHRAERTQAFLLELRYVPAILRFLSDNLPNIARVTERITNFVHDAPSVDDAIARIRTAMSNIPGTLAALLDDTQELVLPWELVPMADLLHIVVALVVRRLGGKYRIAVNLMLTLLDRLGFAPRSSKPSPPGSPARWTPTRTTDR